MKAMNENQTAVTQDIGAEEEKLSDETILLLLKLLVYGVTPVLCVFGVVGNVFSIVILTRHGLHKSSNVLLVSLAFSDCCYLIAFNNVPKMLYDVEGNGRFLYSEKVAYALYFFYFFFTVFDYGMAFLGLTIPALITVERVIAVYFPLQFPTIVTPVRTWAVVAFIGTYGLSVTVYTCFWNQFEYSFDPNYNGTVGRIMQSDLYYKDFEFRSVVDQIHIGVKIQPVVTLVGCILIIIKVKMASDKRQKLSGSANRSAVSKTTKMLLAVCIVYLFVSAISALPAILPEDVLHFSLTSGDMTMMALVMYQVSNLVLCVNSSWNFIIYIVFNVKFRDTFREIVSKHCCSPLSRKGE